MEGTNNAGMAAGVNAPAAGEEAVQQQTQGAQAPENLGQEGKAQQPQTQPKEQPKQQPKETEAQRRARYEALVGKGGEFADFFQQDAQKAVQGRLAKMKAAMDAQQPVLDLLMTRYGTQDMAKVKESLEQDAGWLREYADQHGMTEEQAKVHLATQTQLDAIRRQNARESGERKAEAQFQLWAMQTQEAKEAYPDFDIEAAMKDPNFRTLLQARVPVKTAYEVANMEAIKKSVADQAAKEAELKLTANIQAGAARPVEGAAAGQAGATVKTDPAKMTKEQRQEIAERAQKGEIITFN